MKTLSLSVESRGVWRSSGQKLSDVHGCDDVDLSVTPATNTLPIRHLNLQVGSSESVIAAWVKFPELTVQPHTRLAKDAYRYESNTGFSAEIAVVRQRTQQPTAFEKRMFFKPQNPACQSQGINYLPKASRLGFLNANGLLALKDFS